MHSGLDMDDGSDSGSGFRSRVFCQEKHRPDRSCFLLVMIDSCVIDVCICSFHCPRSCWVCTLSNFEAVLTFCAAAPAASAPVLTPTMLSEIFLVPCVAGLVLRALQRPALQLPRRSQL
jgi:hypothetical protein